MAIQSLRSALMAVNDRIFPGNVVLYEKILNLYLLPSLFVAAELNIAKLLAEKNKSITILANESGSDERSLYRVLRLLASNGIFRENKDKTFSNTRLSEPLKDGRGSLRHVIRHHLGAVNWQITGDLLETVRTGKDGFNRRYGTDIYTHLNSDPLNYSLFDQSMSELSSLGMEPLLQAYNFSKLSVLADIGGGEGFLLTTILQGYPDIQGILFDLPAALNTASVILSRYNLNDRVKVVEGDFLESVPPGADGYILKNVLHNWNDQDCIRILSNIRKVLPKSGKIIIIEMLVPPGNKPSTAKMLDIQMLTSMPGGKERTIEEFKNLLHQANLSLFREYSTIAPISVIEAHQIG